MAARANKTQNTHIGTLAASFRAFNSADRNGTVCANHPLSVGAHDEGDEARDAFVAGAFVTNNASRTSG